MSAPGTSATSHARTCPSQHALALWRGAPGHRTSPCALTDESRSAWSPYVEPYSAKNPEAWSEKPNRVLVMFIEQIFDAGEDSQVIADDVVRREVHRHKSGRLHLMRERPIHAQPTPDI